VVEVFTYRKLTRCQAHYPPPALQFRQWLTLATFLTQYAIPLTITAVAYVGVTRRVWWRAIVGAATQEQLSLQLRAKKKTVKMLLIVVVLFALCWLPLNTYHLVVDFGASVGPSRHSSSVFFICHWFAMSNVCYNPFIYCWLNDHFRAGAKAWLWCVARKICRIALVEDVEEPPGTRVSRPRDSITLSSSALLGGSSIRRKIGSGSLRSSAASDFHVPLDDLMITPPSSTRSSQRRYHSGSVKRGSRKRQNVNIENSTTENHTCYEHDNVQSSTLPRPCGLQKISTLVKSYHRTSDNNAKEIPIPREVDLSSVHDIKEFDSPYPSPSRSTFKSPDDTDLSSVVNTLVDGELIQVHNGVGKIDFKNNTDKNSASTENYLPPVHLTHIETNEEPMGTNLKLQNSRLHPIPEECPKPLVVQPLQRCIDCQKTILPNCFLQKASQTVELVSMPSSASSLRIAEDSGINPHDKDEIHVSPRMSITPEVHRKEVRKFSKGPRDIVRVIHTNFAASLAKRLIAKYSKDSSTFSAKTLHNVPDQPLSPNLNWTEIEISPNSVPLTYVPTDSKVYNTEINSDLIKETNNPEELSKQIYDSCAEVIPSNSIMDSGSVSKTPRASESSMTETENHNKDMTLKLSDSSVQLCVSPSVIGVRNSSLRTLSDPSMNTRGAKYPYSSKLNSSLTWRNYICDKNGGAEKKHIQTSSPSYKNKTSLDVVFSSRLDSVIDRPKNRKHNYYSSDSEMCKNGTESQVLSSDLNKREYKTKGLLCPSLRTVSTPNLSVFNSSLMSIPCSHQSRTSTSSWRQA
ncbi:G-protein coupled receptor, partial [Halocaridina rubra]